MTDDKDKRIAELEKENAKLKDDLDFVHNRMNRNPFADPEFRKKHDMSKVEYLGGGMFAKKKPKE